MEQREAAIIIIKDNPGDVSLLRQAVEQSGSGCPVEAFRDSERALGRIRRGGVRLVLADHALAGGSGLDLLKTLQDEGHNVPVIMLTERVDQQAAKDAMLAGASDCVAKASENFEALTHRVQRVLAEWDTRLDAQAATEAERENEERFRTLVRNIPGIVYVCRNDRRFTMLHISDGVEALTGVPAKEFLHGELSILDLIHPDDAPHVWPAVDTALAERRQFALIYRLKDASGGWRWVEERGQGVFDESGEFSLLQGTLFDITDRKRAEEALRVSEERYRSLFESSKDAVFISTPAGRFLDINPAGVELFGYDSKAELLGVNVGRDLYHDQADRERLKHQLAQHGFVKDFEVRMKTRDGRKLVVLETATAVRNSAGQVEAYRGIMRDVTARRELSERLRHAQKMEAVGTLASGIAHDFNNLLTAIFGYTAMAKSKLPAGDPVTRALEMVEEAAQQASGVTKTLLTFSRKSVAQKAPVDLIKVARDAIRLLRRVMPASVEITAELPADSPVLVRADGSQLQQVLINLAVNSRDAMPNGGQLSVEVRRQAASPGTMTSSSAAQTREVGVLVVEDTGTGMPEEVRKRMFEPFFTTKPRGRGTGLGMSLIHGIINDHGGQVDVDSEPGRGTRITISLPCCEPAKDVAIEAAPEKTAGTGEVILVVEDDVHIRSIMVSTLRSEGYEVIQAGDGVRAMELLADHREATQVVVLDLDLPRKSGLDCLREIRDKDAQLPVFIITGQLDFDGHDQFGPNDILLCKPFQMSDFATLISRTLAKSSQRRVPSVD